MNTEDYETGLRDGRLKSLEDIVRQQSQDMRDFRACVHDEFRAIRNSQKVQERTLWALGGAVFLIQFAPILRDFMQ